MTRPKASPSTAQVKSGDDGLDAVHNTATRAQPRRLVVVRRGGGTITTITTQHSGNHAIEGLGGGVFFWQRRRRRHLEETSPSPAPCDHRQRAPVRGVRRGRNRHRPAITLGQLQQSAPQSEPARSPATPSTARASTPRPQLSWPSGRRIVLQRQFHGDGSEAGPARRQVGPTQTLPIPSNSAAASRGASLPLRRSTRHEDPWTSQSCACVPPKQPTGIDRE